jgi:hypothetical protein
MARTKDDYFSLYLPLIIALVLCIAFCREIQKWLILSFVKSFQDPRFRNDLGSQALGAIPNILGTVLEIIKNSVKT